VRRHGDRRLPRVQPMLPWSSTNPWSGSSVANREVLDRPLHSSHMGHRVARPN
jgi:hypothetical protein